jgi:hypothetical protein
VSSAGPEPACFEQVAISLTVVGSVLGLGAIAKEVAALEDACQFETLKQVWTVPVPFRMCFYLFSFLLLGEAALQSNEQPSGSNLLFFVPFPKVYCLVNKKPFDDPEMLSFFKGRGWGEGPPRRTHPLNVYEKDIKV